MEGPYPCSNVLRTGATYYMTYTGYYRHDAQLHLTTSRRGRAISLLFDKADPGRVLARCDRALLLTRLTWERIESVMRGADRAVTAARTRRPSKTIERHWPNQTTLPCATPADSL